MKQYLKKMLAVTLVCVSVFNYNNLHGQALKFYFVAPENVISTHFGNPVDITECPTGYGKVEITAANAGSFKNTGADKMIYIYNLIQTKKVRDLINKLFVISGGLVDVTYYLTDDQSGIDDAGIFSPTPFDDNKMHVWASARKKPQLPNGRYEGVIMLGEYHFDEIAPDPLKTEVIDEVILHETFHTQWVGPSSKWSGNLRYGGDGSHTLDELLGDQESAMNEGMGNFFGYLFNKADADEMKEQLTYSLYRYFVEAKSILAGSERLYNVPSRIPATSYGTKGFKFKWTDLPGYYILFCESTPAAFFTYFHEKANGNKDLSLNMIIYSASSMSSDRTMRYLTYSCNRLALKMEEYAGTAAGKADNTKTSSMFPFALLDLLTHFGMSDEEYKADYDRHYPDRSPKAYAEYFNKYRKTIRSLVQADLEGSPIRFEEAVNKVRDYFKKADTILTP